MRPDTKSRGHSAETGYRVGARVRTPSGFVVSELDYTPRRRQGPHAHPATSVTLILRGAVRERSGSREDIGRALSVVVKPAGVEHADEYGAEGLDTLQIVVPPAGPTAAADSRCASCWRWIHAGAVNSAFLDVLRALRVSPCDGSSLEWAAMDTLAALDSDLVELSPGVPPVWLRRAREAMDDAAPGSVTVERAAAEAGVHPVSLTRAFRRYYGVTTSRYLRRVRVRHAARLLAESPSPLSGIAYAAGFADQSHMTRVTRKETGATPSELRSLVRPRRAERTARPSPPDEA
jgi:AraC family transcriptional regulator